MKHDPKYEHFSIHKEENRITYFQVCTLQSTDLEQAPYKQKCAFIFFQGNILPFEHSVKERKVKRKTSLSKILGPFSQSCAFI